MEIRKRNNETESDLHKRIENRLIELENANSIEKKMMYIDIIKSMYHHMGPLTDYFSDEYYKRQRHTFNYISNRKNMQEIYTDSIYTDPDVAYEYALKELKGSRFPEGEPIIATSAQHSYLYAWNVIRKRFPMGEDAISTDDYYSLRYAKDVLKLYPNEAKSWREKYLAGETKELV